MPDKGSDTIKNQKAIKIFYKSMYDLFNDSDNDNKLIDKIIFNDIKLTISCEVRKDEVSRIPETEEKTSENSSIYYPNPTQASNSFEKSRFIVKEIDYNDQQNLKGHIEFLSKNLQQSFLIYLKISIKTLLLHGYINTLQITKKKRIVHEKKLYKK